MQKQDIINTAFTEWGKTQFRRTNLTSIAEALEVSKTALYRYFPNKKSLLQAMHEQSEADFISISEQLRLNAPYSHISNALQDFFTIFLNRFTQNPDRFLFLILFAEWKSDNRQKNFTESMDEMGQIIHDSMQISGIKTPSPSNLSTTMHFLLITAVFWVIRTTQMGCDPDIEEAVNLCLHGINGNPQVQLPPLEELINSCCVQPKDLTKQNKIFTAVAETVRQVGMENASMGKIAEHLNMSKSSLYFYFTNKEEMMTSMLEEEQQTLQSIYAAYSSKYSDSWQRIMCHAFILTSYLIQKPEMLITFGWIRIKNLHVKVKPHGPENMGQAAQYLLGPLNSGNFNLHGLRPEEFIFLLNIQLTREIMNSFETGTRENEIYSRIYDICRLFHCGIQGANL